MGEKEGEELGVEEEQEGKEEGKEVAVEEEGEKVLGK